MPFLLLLSIIFCVLAVSYRATQKEIRKYKETEVRYLNACRCLAAYMLNWRESSTRSNLLYAVPTSLEEFDRDEHGSLTQDAQFLELRREVDEAGIDYYELRRLSIDRAECAWLISMLNRLQYDDPLYNRAMKLVAYARPR